MKRIEWQCNKCKVSGVVRVNDVFEGMNNAIIQHKQLNKTCNAHHTELNPKEKRENEQS